MVLSLSLCLARFVSLSIIFVLFLLCGFFFGSLNLKMVFVSFFVGKNDFGSGGALF